MAPEQTTGDDVDARTDLFSFGLVLYEMGAGRPAFNGTTNAELRDAILTKTPTPIHEVNPSIPQTLEEVITKALAKNRELRYQSASELRGDLLRMKQGLESGETAAPEFPSIWPGKRFLEAAAPKEATVGRSIEVIAMVRESATSGGLREFLGNEKAPNLTAEDVRERPVDLEFPVSEKGKPQPLDITLRLDSPGFDPRVQTKKLRVPPTEDSPPCAFLIVPRVVGELVINLELLSVHEQVTCTSQIKAGSACALRVRFKPRGVQKYQATLEIRTIGDNISVELSGNGRSHLIN